MNHTIEPTSVLCGWRASKIEVVDQGRAVEVEFTINGRSPFRFRTRKFGIGGRNARTAALARFAAAAGYGDVETVFRYLRGMPKDNDGSVFPCGPLRQMPNDTSGYSFANLYPEHMPQWEESEPRSSLRLVGTVADC